MLTGALRTYLLASNSCNLNCYRARALRTTFPIATSVSHALSSSTTPTQPKTPAGTYQHTNTHAKNTATRNSIKCGFSIENQRASGLRE